MSVYNRCLLNCPAGDALCLSECAREYQGKGSTFLHETKIRTSGPNCQKENLNRCPCQYGCPNGCPCPEYTCPGSDISSSDILVLSTFNSLNVPIITNGWGKDDRDFSFSLDTGTEVYSSCGLTWQNRHFIFGGANQMTQISMVDDCTLKLVGQLEFIYRYGACASVDDRLIYLCFTNDSGSFRKCRYSTSPLGEFQQISDSNHDHFMTRIAADKSKFYFIYHDFTNLFVNQFLV